MARSKWKAHCGGGRLLVATDTEVWVAPASPKSPAAFVPLPRDAAPQSPIRCVATDGKHAIFGCGNAERTPWGDEDLVRGGYRILVVDLTDYSVVADVEADWLGHHLGVVSGHVVDWTWVAQGDVLSARVPVQLNGAPPSFDASVFEAYDYCGALGVRGDLIVGSIDYREKLYVSSPGESPREVRVPQPYRNPRAFAHIGFNDDDALVLTVQWSVHNEAWLLGENDEWMPLGKWIPQSKSIVEFAGRDGRPVRLKESQLPE